jgi:uridylate kinase
MTVAKPVDVEARSVAPPFRRVLLKLSGEALMGTAEFGLDAPTVDALAKELVGVQASGVELALVIGGGNVYRGMKAAAAGMDRATGDYMGMLATVFNSLAVQEALERNGADTRVLSALDVREADLSVARTGAGRPRRGGARDPRALGRGAIEAGERP